MAAATWPHADGLERVAQYIIRNPFSEQKMVYNAENGTVIYRSRTRPAVAMGRQGRMHAKTKRNFEIFQPEDFILLRSSSYGGQVAARSDERLGCPT